MARYLEDSSGRQEAEEQFPPFPRRGHLKVASPTVQEPFVSIGYATENCYSREEMHCPT